MTDIQALDSRYVAHTYARAPVTFVRGEGCRLYDEAGKAYIDMGSGIAVNALGYGDEGWVAAVSAQAGQLAHASNLYHTAPQALLAQRLCERTGMKRVFFGNSGAEANECAIKVARRYSALKHGENVRPVILTLENSFHGRTLATLAATAQPAKQEAFQPLPDGFVRTPINDIKALESLFASQGDGICAVMVECVQGESGVHPCTAEFLAAVRRLTAECGALFMCDEIQCGMYRCGTHPFGFQHFGVTPDVVTIAKGIASGFPMGMCAARAQVAASFDPGDHGSTFGGSCLAVAAAEATVRALAAEDAAGNAERTGAYLREKLTALPQVEEVRGLGLMVACDLAEGVSAPDVVLAGLDEGLLLNFTGPRTLRFLPPLVCSKEDVDVLVQKLAALLS